jgi:hypothetical protein
VSGRVRALARSLATSTDRLTPGNRNCLVGEATKCQANNAATFWRNEVSPSWWSHSLLSDQDISPCLSKPSRRRGAEKSALRTCAIQTKSARGRLLRPAATDAARYRRDSGRRLA